MATKDLVLLTYTISSVYHGNYSRAKRIHFGTGIREDEKKWLSTVIKDFLEIH